MKAVVITKAGDAEVLKLQDRDKPFPAQNQVLIKVKAAGINRADILMRKGLYGAGGLTIEVPGLEVAGIVEECGENVKDWKSGDKVCALLKSGGYSEYVTVDSRHCLPVPDGYSFEQAASLPEAILTVWHNVFQRGNLKTGDNFLIHGGSSGIGITAIQLAKNFGANVFATAGSEEKCKACEELGALKCINYKKEDFEQTLKDIGIDVILDMVGGDYTAKNLKILNPEGHLVFIAALNGRESNFNIMDIMSKRLNITGSMLSPRDDDFKAQLIAEVKENVWQLLQTEKFKPVIYKVFDLKDASQAHKLMESSEHIGKIILKCE